MEKPDYYVLPTRWCEHCAKQVTCDVLAWDVANERLATFICPTCGRPLGVGLRGQTAWTPLAPRARRAPRPDPDR